MMIFAWAFTGVVTVLVAGIIWMAWDLSRRRNIAEHCEHQWGTPGPIDPRWPTDSTQQCTRCGYMKRAWDERHPSRPRPE